jgi:two-component system, NarL family, sensor kinase
MNNSKETDVLEKDSLEKAIAHFAKVIDSTGKIGFDTDYRLKMISRSFEKFLYRTTAELISNTVKHSAASRVRICIHQNKSSIVYIYGDNGKGFDVGSLNNPEQIRGTGLLLIMQSVNKMKGLYTIRSKKGEGMIFEMVFDNNEINK